MSEKKILNYEESIQQLELILDNLEQTDIPLEESIKKFEQGVTLVKHCQSILKTTEQKVKGLIENMDET